MPASERFKQALRNSHVPISRANLRRGPELLYEDLPVLSGEVTDDGSAKVRRRCNLVLPGIEEILDLVPQTQPSNGGLWPLGNELELFSGIRYPSAPGVPADEELQPIGIFRISKPVLSDSGLDLSMSVEGFDRSRTISRAGFTEPYSVTAGANYAEAIATLVLSRAPWMDSGDLSFMTTPYTTPSLVFLPSDDPWDMATKMAESIGAELFFDGAGMLVLQPQPDPLYTPSSFDYVEGEDATFTEITRDLDDQEAYNGVVIISENSDLTAPLTAQVWDTDPSSPTYYDPASPGDSIYGPVPKIVSSQLITTQAQAEEAAGAEFARITGIIEKIEFNAINNPAHSSGDVIQVTRERVNVNSVYLLESLRIGVGATTSMSATTRRRRAG